MRLQASALEQLLLASPGKSLRCARTLKRALSSHRPPPHRAVHDQVRHAISEQHGSPEVAIDFEPSASEPFRSFVVEGLGIFLATRRSPDPCRARDSRQLQAAIARGRRQRM